MEQQKSNIHLIYPCNCGYEEHITNKWAITKLNGVIYLWWDCKNGSTHIVPYTKVTNKIIPENTDLFRVSLDRITWEEMK